VTIDAKFSLVGGTTCGKANSICFSPSCKGLELAIVRDRLLASDLLEELEELLEGVRRLTPELSENLDEELAVDTLEGDRKSEIDMFEGDNTLVPEVFGVGSFSVGRLVFGISGLITFTISDKLVRIASTKKVLIFL
jgi:hypothetical protein